MRHTKKAETTESKGRFTHAKFEQSLSLALFNTVIVAPMQAVGIKMVGANSQRF